MSDDSPVDEFQLDDFFPVISTEGVKERLPPREIVVGIPIDNPAEFCRITGIPVENLRVNSNESNGKVYELEFDILSPAQHSLWAHCVWNAGKSLAKAILNGYIDVRGKRILELGAASALPSMAAVIMGADMVIATDYDEESLIAPLQRNMEINMNKYGKFEEQGHWKVIGYCWGETLEEVRQINDRKPFDLVIQSDVICNHFQHSALQKSIKLAAKGGSYTEALVYFTHHRVWLIKEDLQYFSMAKENGFQVQKMYEDKYPVMFEEDNKFDKSEEDRKIRETVHAYRLIYTEGESQ